MGTAEGGWRTDAVAHIDHIRRGAASRLTRRYSRRNDNPPTTPRDLPPVRREAEGHAGPSPFAPLHYPMISPAHRQKGVLTILATSLRSRRPIRRGKARRVRRIRLTTTRPCAEVREADARGTSQ